MSIDIRIDRRFSYFFLSLPFLFAVSLPLVLSTFLSDQLAPSQYCLPIPSTFHHTSLRTHILVPSCVICARCRWLCSTRPCAPSLLLFLPSFVQSRIGTSRPHCNLQPRTFLPAVAECQQSRQQEGFQRLSPQCEPISPGRPYCRTTRRT